MTNTKQPFKTFHNNYFSGNPIPGSALEREPKVTSSGFVFRPSDFYSFESHLDANTRLDENCNSTLNDGV